MTPRPAATPRPSRGGVPAALGAALLFGAGAPAAKALAGEVSSALVLAGLLYLGSGLGLAIVHAVQRARGRAVAPLPREGRARFAAAVVVGGVAAPALLMLGLARAPASTASLLLNLEGVLTALVAWTVFREHTHARNVAGFACVAAGAVLLTASPGAWGGLRGAGLEGGGLIAGACACWALDNNLTRAVSSADPVRVAMIKGLAAGATNTALGLAFAGGALPGARVVAAALVVGFFAYGVSLVLFVVALRHLGTARTGAYFSTAPFAGALLSLALLHEAPTLALGAAGVLMAAGVALHASERHAHEHVHEPVLHSHAHVHDEHHRHAHPPGVDVGEPHVHEHVHDRLVHAHAHAPDIHHRHDH